MELSERMRGSLHGAFLFADEVAQLEAMLGWKSGRATDLAKVVEAYEAESAALKELLSEAMFAHKSGWFDLDLLDRMQDALLKGGEDETE